MESRLWLRMLEQYGQKVVLHKGEDTEIRAFFQPVKENKPGESPSPLGVGPQGLYLYLGPAGETLEEVTGITWEGRDFEILRHRAVFVGDEVLYQWALCREMDEVRV